MSGRAGKYFDEPVIGGFFLVFVAYTRFSKETISS